MNIVDTILDGGLADRPGLRIAPKVGIVPRVKLTRDSIPADPLFDRPSDETTRLRTIFFRVLVQDQSPGVPFVRLIEKLKMTCRAGVISKTSPEARRAFWKARFDAEGEAQKERQRQDLMRDLPGSSQETIERMASKIDIQVLALLTEKEPSETDYVRALGEVAETLKENEAWLAAAAEETAYQLRVHTLPHQWLSNRLIWEARNYLDEVKSRTLGLTPYSSTPAWRSEVSLEPVRPSVSLRLYADEPEDVLQTRIEEARSKIRDLRKGRRGRKTWDGTKPSDELLLRLLYLHLQGMSYQRLLNSHRLDVHRKTFEHHLRRTKERIFSDEDEPMLRGSEIDPILASFRSLR